MRVKLTFNWKNIRFGWKHVFNIPTHTIFLLRKVRYFIYLKGTFVFILHALKTLFRKTGFCLKKKSFAIYIGKHRMYKFYRSVKYFTRCILYFVRDFIKYGMLSLLQVYFISIFRSFLTFRIWSSYRERSLILLNSTRANSIAACSFLSFCNAEYKSLTTFCSPLLLCLTLHSSSR